MAITAIGEVDDMTRIVLDLVGDVRGDHAPTPVQGSLTIEDGTVSPFVGWAELLVLLEASIATTHDTTRPESTP